MTNLKRLGFMLLCLLIFKQTFSQENIPLPEHPRPDSERSEWLNLNGNWAFEFDKNDTGEKETGYGWIRLAGRGRILQHRKAGSAGKYRCDPGQKSDS